MYTCKTCATAGTRTNFELGAALFTFDPPTVSPLPVSRLGGHWEAGLQPLSAALLRRTGGDETSLQDLCPPGGHGSPLGRGREDTPGDTAINIAAEEWVPGHWLARKCLKVFRSNLHLANASTKPKPNTPPFADALSTRNLEVMCTTLKIIQQLVMSSDLVGPALVPFYRQLLPMFNAFKVKNCRYSTKLDYFQ